ncbi:MAG: NADH-quinone oxidoreductase subunit NuoF [Acidobacteriota bacterium]|nr:NADH-quinone oxidoreductase subunit NuoF [Thermoanaerobaculaceae bacterium]
MALEEKILTANIGKKTSSDIDSAMQGGAYEALIKALTKMTPEQVLNEVKISNLKGRGGAGFPTALKWSFLPKEKKKIKYLVCNADESEPGTFKDRLIIENDPHKIIEGIIIAAYATNANAGFIYIRGEMPLGAKILEKAISQAYERHFLGKNIMGSGLDFDIFLVRGAGAYICGEETALMNSIEGKRGEPRIKPPFPASYGVYGKPSNINNVETYANVPAIIKNGGNWYANLGSKDTPGTRLFGLSGHIKKPGIYELTSDVTVRELIFNYGGGILGDKKLKAVIPGGSSVPVLTSNEIDVEMDSAGLKKVGSMPGSAGVIVMNETVCMVKALLNLIKFYEHESCGQCTPCREGTHFLRLIIEDIEKGEGKEGDLEKILSLCKNIMGRTICPLGDAAAMPCESFVKKFREEFEYHIKEKKCLPETIKMTTVF